MSLRTFVDSAGHEWHAFDVVPRDEERRSYDRRSGEIQLEDVEDRREQDRRLTVGRARTLGGGPGWLCFENGAERRRLSPIPEGWTHADDTQLEAYLLSARPVRQSTTNARPA